VKSPIYNLNHPVDWSSPAHTLLYDAMDKERARAHSFLQRIMIHMCGERIVGLKTVH
jgi:hypothetical protein